MRRVNWEALGSIAELVGAAGVVVSLLYVATEIQQNTRQVEEATRVQRLSQLDATFENFSRQRLVLAGNRDAARVVLVGMEDPDALSPVERLQFENMLGEFLHASQVLFARAQEGIVYPEVWDNLVYGLEPLLRRPAVVAYWERQKPEFRSGFVATVDSLIAATPARAGEARSSTP
jgi:hypothetical protein